MRVLGVSSQTAARPDALLEVEARLYFVSAIANRIRMNVPPGGTEGDDSNISISNNSANAASPSTDPRNDNFLLQLLPLLPQMALLASQDGPSGPPVEITEREALTLFLHAAAARAISWLSGRVLPQHQELFAPLFSLLVTRALQFVASLPVRLRASRLPSANVPFVHISSFFAFLSVSSGCSASALPCDRAAAG